MHGRLLFTTQDGYLGLASDTVQPGDVIAMFYGGCTPYVLRRTKTETRMGGWSFLGEAYVHGMMDGEALSLESETDFALV